MPVRPGSRLGPYEILSAIGAGGMGEVWRARDSRLGRDVAIKVLPSSFSADADRLRRFEQEARAAGILNHPNITAVLDIGEHEGAPYVVQELLEGETLRRELAGGRLPTRRAIEHAIQIATGLAAAHAKGIVHRDLKPENVFVTNDGRLKILDFGLAKLIQPEADSPSTNMPTATAGTEPGVVLGTLGYMSPEQVRGRPADARSDIFSFGAILYEMLAGQRPFRGDSAADTMSSILKEDPPDISLTNASVTPGIERIIRHCLEKNPEQRFQSARDLAFDLEALSGVSMPSRQTAGAAADEASSSRRRRLAIAATTLLLAGAFAGGYFLGSRRGATPPPAFRQLTFRRGAIWRARLAPDGKSAFYSASWNGKPSEIYVNHPDSPESRPFSLTGADVAAISPSGELAVILRSDFEAAFIRSGTLARVGATGGTPREILEKVSFADWSPDGRNLAIVRTVDRRSRLEFPPGKVLYETAGWVGDPRFSPQGDRIAFVDHPVAGDDGGSVAILDVNRKSGKGGEPGKPANVTPVYASAQGLAWSPDGSEVWFTSAEFGGNRRLRAAPRAPGGRVRPLAGVTGSLTLHDVTRDGRVLVSHDQAQVGLITGTEPANEIDVSWLDWTLLASISPDGRTVAFTESGEGGGPGYSAYVRGTDGSPAVRLGEGYAQALSPDGKRLLVIVNPTGDRRLVSYPTGAGDVKTLTPPGFAVEFAQWSPDGRRIVLTANEGNHDARVYGIDAVDGAAGAGASSPPRPILPEGYRTGAGGISPDGKRIVARGPEDRFYICSLEGDPRPTAIPGLSASGDSVYGWGIDGRSLFVRHGTLASVPARILRKDVATGREEKWRDFIPADAAGLNAVQLIRVTPDEKVYAYSYYRSLSNLYVASGIR